VVAQTETRSFIDDIVLVDGRTALDTDVVIPVGGHTALNARELPSLDLPVLPTTQFGHVSVSVPWSLQNLRLRRDEPWI